MKTTIFFDFDDTILYSMKFWNDVIDRQMFLCFNKPIIKDFYSLRSGMGNYEILNLFINLNNLQTDAESLVKLWYNLMMPNYTKKVKLVKGVKIFLQRLVEKGYKLAITSASDNKMVGEVLEHYDLKKYFSHIISEHLAGAPKRERAYFDFCLKEVGCKGQEVILFEDSYLNISSAKQLGIDCIGLKTKLNKAKHKNLESNCIFTITNYCSKKLKKYFFS